jgi:hypothetical protein
VIPIWAARSVPFTPALIPVVTKIHPQIVLGWQKQAVISLTGQNHITNL